MTVVSMCHISLARVVRRPIFGFAGCTRSRGRRQPYCRTRRYQVEGEAQTLLRRRARPASVPGGTCPYLTAVTMSSIARTSEDKGEPKECGELLYASPELQDFLVEGRRAQVRHVQAHHDLRCLAEPTTGRRARDSENRGDGHI